MAESNDKLGIVVIGRNEGRRLRACLTSVAGAAAGVVYVDSASSDDSVEIAREMGADVVPLDQDSLLTAARARNAGFQRLATTHPELTLVQFIDGDTQVCPGWLELAATTLADRPELAVVCGRRREKFPEVSVYNRMCDMEWNTLVGETAACGGDAMMRVEAFKAVKGFDEALIAGEEPELCVRLRADAWKIWRLDADMTIHDAAMTRFSQWWRRNMRAGHAFAEGAALHGDSAANHWVKESRSNWVWGLIIPALVLLLAWWTRGLSAVFLLGYVLLFMRVRKYRTGRGDSYADAQLYAIFCVFGKFPQAQGQLQYLLRRAGGRKRGLIEYKAAPDHAASAKAA